MKVVVAGDFSPYLLGQDLIDSGEYIYQFSDIKSIISRNDIAIVNFETNISTDDCTPIDKNGVRLTTNENAINLIKHLGFNVVTLANNHFYDYGDKAVEKTIGAFKKADIAYVGGGRNIGEASKTLFIRQGDETLAIINACEHEFSIATEDHGGAYGIDPIKIFYDIQAAKGKADYILVIIHGGLEHLPYPSPRMQEWYRFFVDAGADAVVNHHQHCVCGREIRNGKPIYYGLGNFYFYWPGTNGKKKWNKGILVELDFSKNAVTHNAIPYYQGVDGATISLDDNLQEFDESFKTISDVISDPKQLSQVNTEFYEKSKRNILTNFQPYLSRLSKSAYNRRLLPSLLSRKKKMAILNMIECEAHYDRLLHILK